MAVKFFGQFLVEKGVISREILLKAIELQESVNLSFGEIALSMGFLSKQDIERVNQAQRTDDQRFGDMAVKLGLLSQEQLLQVLTRQKNSHIYIGEALVKVGGMDDEALKRHLEEFKEDQAQYITDRVAIPAGVQQQEIWEMMADLTYKMLTRVARITFRPGPCSVAERLGKNHVAAAIDFSGDINARYVLAVSAGVQASIAKAILNEEDLENEPREVLNDVVMEFVNVVCGNIAAKGAQSGKNMEISPPELLDATSGIAIQEGCTGLLFPLCLADGEQAELALIIRTA